MRWRKPSLYTSLTGHYRSLGLNATEEQIAEQQPLCKTVSEEELDCADRDVWLELRKDYSERRLVCDSPSSPAHSRLTARSAFVDILTTIYNCA
jgi:hypothetical protein